MQQWNNTAHSKVSNLHKVDKQVNQRSKF